MEGSRGLREQLRGEERAHVDSLPPERKLEIQRTECREQPPHALSEIWHSPRARNGLSNLGHLPGEIPRLKARQSRTRERILRGISKHLPPDEAWVYAHTAQGGRTYPFTYPCRFLKVSSATPLLSSCPRPSATIRSYWSFVAAASGRLSLASQPSVQAMVLSFAACAAEK